MYPNSIHMQTRTYQVRYACVFAWLVLLAASAAAQSEANAMPPISTGLPDAPSLQPATSGAEKRPLIGPANCISPAFATTNPEAAAAARVVARPCTKPENVFERFLSTSEPHPLSPEQKLKLAIKNFTNPFNFLTVAADSAIFVAANAHSDYGPGMKGFGWNVGTSLSQDATGEFVGVFLIPSIVHQDPHYHRMPNASLVRRILHCAYQPFWTTSDTGKGMVNYSTIAGSIIDEAVDVTYVPYQRVGWGPGAERIASGWASAPIGNFVTEFLPDVASHVNFKVVFIQRIINRVALEDGGS